MLISHSFDNTASVIVWRSDEVFEKVTSSGYENSHAN